MRELNEGRRKKRVKERPNSRLGNRLYSLAGSGRGGWLDTCPASDAGRRAPPSAPAPARRAQRLRVAPAPGWSPAGTAGVLEARDAGCAGEARRSAENRLCLRPGRQEAAVDRPPAVRYLRGSVWAAKRTPPQPPTFGGARSEVPELS